MGRQQNVVRVLPSAHSRHINLTTATALQRAKEISLRKVAGATRRQLTGQFYTETLVISIVAVTLALLALQLALPAFSTWLGQSYHFIFNIRNVTIIVSFIIGITVLSGFYPSIVLSSFQPVVALKGRFLHSNSGQASRKTLVVFQFTISTVLLISILTVHHQMQFIRQTPLGYESDAVISIGYNGDGSVQKHYQAIRNELMSMPYIEAVSRHNANVVGGMGNGWITTENNHGEEVTTSIYGMGIDADYLNTYGIEMAAGRNFSKHDNDSLKSVLVNEAAVRLLGWPTAQDAIGKPFGKGDQTKYVVGVVKDFHFESLHKRVEPVLIRYVSNAGGLSLRIQKTKMEEAIAHLKSVWTKFAPDVPLQYSFIDDSLAEQYVSEKKMESVFYIFAGMSLLIACMGLFGLSTFMMQQRIREIGIRKVLGANVRGIVVLLTSDFSKLVLVSALLAIPIGWYAMNSWLESFAYHTTISWWIFSLAVIVPITIALLTVSVQTIKAALINPVKTLRSE